MSSSIPTKFARAEGLLQAGDSRAADALFREILAEDSSHAASIHGMALVASAQSNFAAALEFSQIAIGFDPKAAAYHNTAAASLARLGRLAEAADSYARAVELDPGLAEAHYMRGSGLWRLGRFEEAAESFDRALDLQPAFVDLHNGRIYEMLKVCDWTRYEDLVRRATEAVRAGRLACDPFTFAALTPSVEDQLQCSRVWSERHYQAQPPLWTGETYRHDRIRLAYVSADLHVHAVSYLMAGLFERHDRSRFEVIAFSLGPRTKSPIRDRLIGAFDQFIDVRDKTEREIAEMIRAMEIDVLVDLKGYTTDSRPTIFTWRPAPVQVNYLGFPGTLGSPFYDYIVGDAHITPPEHDPFYTEAVVRLPETYFPTDQEMPISPGTPTRAEAGLPEDAFVFCGFNKNYKLAPQMFGVWMNILSAVTGSVLWLTDGGDAVRANLRREAKARGVDPERLIFAPRAPLREDHLARHRAADLYLDSLPYNGHTTSIDALWAGLPVLTCTGPTWIGRVATSLLTALDMPEMITDSLGDYEALAVKLARDPAALAEVRAKLAAMTPTAPLFDTDRLRRHLEAAYIGMHERHQGGEPPKGFDVPVLG
jgi:protein O-GlcNAc transferase